MIQVHFFFPSKLVLLTPARCDLITVCREDDGDLRVDCLVKGKPNKINSYEFSWSSGSKQSLINSNVSGLAAEAEFRQVSRVTEVEPHGYRLTLSGYRDKLPHNTTYMCKITGEGASVNVERGECREGGHSESYFFTFVFFCRSSHPMWCRQRVSAELLDCRHPAFIPLHVML
uniref:Ig-like domain-containing protein n=1 Tax=Hippocampus comes TaxID=109280 RepID=A0A3Q2YQK0_HIPCM